MWNFWVTLCDLVDIVTGAKYKLYHTDLGRQYAADGVLQVDGDTRFENNVFTGVNVSFLPIPHHGSVRH